MALENSQNLFATIVMAHLKTKETHDAPAERKTWKFYLMTMLYDRGFRPQDILELYNFLDWLMQLPEELERQFQLEIEQFEEARQMKYVTSIERMAGERGIEEGREEERRSLALKMLHENIPLEAIIRITGLSIVQLQQLQADQAQ